MLCKVILVMDGDTIGISPRWRFRGETGNRVRIRGYDAPELNTRAGRMARAKLRKLVSGKRVKLKNPVKFTYGRLLCDVYLGKKNVAAFFPECQ